MQFSSRSHIGKKRRRNEDSLLVDPNAQCVALADGVGGQNKGEAASQLAVDASMEYINSLSQDNRVSERELANAIRYANEQIITIQRNNEEFAKMGATLCCLTVSQTELFFSWVGDSRIYLIQTDQGTIKMLTKDHTLDSSKIDASLAPNLHKRAGSILTQMVGSTLYLKPDTGSVKVVSGDIVLACTDGLTDLVSEDKLLALALEHSGSLESLSDKYLDLALDYGGHDNISFVIARV